MNHSPNGWTDEVAVGGVERMTQVHESRCGLVGVYWFLGSEVALFGGLILAVLFLRWGSTNWIEGAGHLSSTTAILATACLLGATVSFGWALRGAVARRWPLIVVSVVGSAFLVVKVSDYVEHWKNELRPDCGVFWAAYYLLTGLHAAHVLAGVFLAGFCAWMLARRDREKLRRWTRGLRLYWYFVDTIWFCLLALFYAG